jgi:hypothetical protein
LCLVGLNAPLHLGPDSLSQDDLDALCAFLRALPQHLPPVDPHAPRPLRRLLPVQVDPRLGRRDPVLSALDKATHDAADAAKALDVPLQSALVGTLNTPTFAEVEEPIVNRAKDRHGRTLSDKELDALEAAYKAAAGLPFVGLARALWDALPAWMKDSP